MTYGRIGLPRYPFPLCSVWWQRIQHDETYKEKPLELEECIRSLMRKIIRTSVMSPVRCFMNFMTQRRHKGSNPSVWDGWWRYENCGVADDTKACHDVWTPVQSWAARTRTYLARNNLEKCQQTVYRKWTIEKWMKTLEEIGLGDTTCRLEIFFMYEVESGLLSFQRFFFESGNRLTARLYQWN